MINRLKKLAKKTQKSKRIINYLLWMNTWHVDVQSVCPFSALYPIRLHPILGFLGIGCSCLRSRGCIIPSIRLSQTNVFQMTAAQDRPQKDNSTDAYSIHGVAFLLANVTLAASMYLFVGSHYRTMI